MGVTLVVIVLALTVGWILTVVSYSLRQAGRLGVAQWFLVIGGGVLFGLVITGLILFIVGQARLIRDNQRQTNFLDAVSHELRSPLTSLKLHLDTLRLRNLPAEKVQEFHVLMSDDVERLQGLVERLLEAGRAEHRGRQYHLERVEVAPLVASMVALARRRYGLAGDSIRIMMPDLVVEADPAALEIVVYNLVENAIKYSREGQVDILILGSRTSDGDVAIRVRDSGVGIPRSQLKRIFTRFYRLGNELTRTRKGTGLGLYLVRVMVREMRGKIEAMSPGDNLGSTFVLTLREPRNRPESRRRDAATKARAGEPGGQGPEGSASDSPAGAPAADPRP